uniref:U62-Liphistoxin-Lsp1b_1 n=1 Tax=Liphistius sp. SGP-2016 TaxID=1905180 RepID=A0A4Q8K4I8_9ARAC
MKGIVAIFVILGLVIASEAGTDCQEAREKAKQSKFFLQMIPNCDEDGNYLPLQCYEHSKSCMCVKPDGSVVTPPDFHIRACKCILESKNAFQPHLIGNYVPQCERDGTYSRTQCHGSTGYCWCVDEKGVRLSESVPPGQDIRC